MTTNLINWPVQYCPCVVPLRQLIDVAGHKHRDCGLPVAPWDIEKDKFDREAGPRRESR